MKRVFVAPVLKAESTLSHLTLGTNVSGEPGD